MLSRHVQGAGGWGSHLHFASIYAKNKGHHLCIFDVPKNYEGPRGLVQLWGKMISEEEFFLFCPCNFRRYLILAIR